MSGGAARFPYFGGALGFCGVMGLARWGVLDFKWGGAFPWAADYDAAGDLSLIRPLAQGMGLNQTT